MATNSDAILFPTELLAPKKLLVIFGATGVGKTDYSISLAQKLHCPIVSCDSRQIYKEMNIGVAKPTLEQLSAVPHYFVGTRSVAQNYTAGMYEHDALQCLQTLFEQYSNVVLVGGSGLYMEALCFGMDATPPADEALRTQLEQRLEREGIEALVQNLQQLDPVYCSSSLDLQNPRRVLRALEVCLITKQPYSQICKHSRKQRLFEVQLMGLQRDRDVLYQRINRRVDSMMNEGLLDEVKQLLPYRRLNALQTVGYRELFDYLDNKISLPEAITLIKRNSRRYAKRQLSWLRRYDDAEWVVL
ncbi:tRNA dimethylallyltransferase 1 [Bacteroidia bacterium]|nr:tRNA dimethylallyltransferase 1 [Bacteroidia bacterium]